MDIFFDKSVSVHRLIANGSKMSFQTLTTTLDGTFQPLSQEKAQMFDGGHGDMFVFFTDAGKNIKQGDKIMHNGITYKVASGGVDDRNDGLIADYMSIYCTKL
jgi:hypothetical protein